MRKKIVAGNWKMNTTKSQAKTLVEGLNSISDQFSSDVEVIVAPPSLYVDFICTMVEKGISVAGQNCHAKDFGAYTGELSAEMLQSVGATYCLVGHSERRAYFKEDAQFLADKVSSLLTAGITPIFCCGEEFSDRESEVHFDLVKRQISDSLFHLNPEQMEKVVVAYEPVWAIGTGKTASAEQAQEMHAFIRNCIKEQYSEELANSVSILYGGSCKPENANQLFNCADIDGGLIGGASLKADSFGAIVQAF